MFEESLVESTPLLRTHNRWPAVASLMAQLIAAAIILALPLLHPEILSLPRIGLTSLAPPKPPTPPLPVVHLRPAASSATNQAAPASTYNTPVFTPLFHPSGPPVEAPALPVVDLADHFVSPLGVNTAPRAGPHVTVTKSATKPPLPVSSGVIAGLLLAPIHPDYPTIAITTHTEGAVVIDAIISRSGSIESAHVLSGPPMLRRAALDAVQQARYRPFLLNGQPTEVQTAITINFRIGG